MRYEPHQSRKMRFTLLSTYYIFVRVNEGSAVDVVVFHPVIYIAIFFPATQELQSSSYPALFDLNQMHFQFFTHGSGVFTQGVDRRRMFA